MASGTPSGGWLSRTWAAKPRRSRKASAPSRSGPSAGTPRWGLHPAPARAHLPAGGRAGEGARPARAAAEDPVLALARLAPDRPHVRAAQGQPALRAAGGGEVGPQEPHTTETRRPGDHDRGNNICGLSCPRCLCGLRFSVSSRGSGASAPRGVDVADLVHQRLGGDAAGAELEDSSPALARTTVPCTVMRESRWNQTVPSTSEPRSQRSGSPQRQRRPRSPRSMISYACSAMMRSGRDSGR